MNIALWVAQGLLAVAMLAAGMLKIVTPRLKLAEKMGWAADWSNGGVKLLGVAEVLGAVGVVVPWATHIAPVLTPIAALCLLVLMIGAVKTHVDRKEPTVPAAVLAAIALFVGIGRFIA